MRHELLAPAGSYDVCEAVIAAGADAVYLGGEKFSARAYAPNFSEPDILRALDLAHLHGRKIYLALNTLLKNREMDRELYRYIEPFYENGLDAIITQDYGVFQFVKTYFPELPIHISTQMSVANHYGADFLKEKGAKRIIPARELSLAEIRTLRSESDIEIECFVHGALCYCYSGQCLMSSLIGGRSGNRGRCAQPCRLPYQVKDQDGSIVGSGADYPLSLKDLCAIDWIPRMCEAGVDAFKIEGRMKSLAYAAGVTRIYREYLDRYERDPAKYSVSDKDRKKLLALGNRSGFTEGYFAGCADRSMLTLTDSSHTSGDASSVFQAEKTPVIPLKGKIVLRPGQPAKLTVMPDPGQKESTAAEAAAGIASPVVTVTGVPVQEAATSPLTFADVCAHIEKTGDTPFVFSSLDVDMEGACFVPVKQLNELRRDALGQMKQRMLSPAGRTAGERTGRDEADRSRSVLPRGAADNLLDVTICTQEQLEEVLACPFVGRISLDLDADGAYFGRDGRFAHEDYRKDLGAARERITAAGKQAGYCFPYVFRGNTSTVFEKEEWRDALKHFDVLWARSFDSLGYCLALPGLDRSRIRLDAGIYVFSEQTWHDFSLEGIGGYTSPVELNSGELAHMPNGQAEFTVYGYTPVMVSAQCIYKNYAECDKNGRDKERFYLSDRYGREFFVKRNCKDCYNIIYNSRPTYLFHRAKEIRKLEFSSHRISLVAEDGDTTAEILRGYRRAFLLGESLPAPADGERFTNGHFIRGVE